ncbi:MULTISPECIES: hypothetical protein [unclassified Xanthomonas]|uniref:hypothetical protein n=1 Tax=unclassified Xanthomonas TaxID=2643310 RepID=UPI002B229BFF|nr:MULTISPECIES: hypothetical protein [unclassified Xanthomonas]MEA9564813.1 hypothetical protein [Xanthomonas sp. WHRI 8932A]MEA9635191.1 hypothetical protein [Xanthomonas sp. WHRI 8812E]
MLLPLGVATLAGRLAVETSLRLGAGASGLGRSDAAGRVVVGCHYSSSHSFKARCIAGNSQRTLHPLFHLHFQPPDIGGFQDLR